MFQLQRNLAISAAAIGLSALLFTTIASAKGSASAYSSGESLRLLAHLPIDGQTSVKLKTSEGGKALLYVNYLASKKTTVIDVSNPQEPKVIQQDVAADGVITAALGDIVLQDADTSKGNDPATKSVQIISFSNPDHPRIVQNFDGVTGQLVDPSRQLIYIVNHDGLWILQHRTVQNQQAADEFDKRLRYDR
jgi:hypothetical protein